MILRLPTWEGIKLVADLSFCCPAVVLPRRPPQPRASCSWLLPRPLPATMAVTPAPTRPNHSPPFGRRRRLRRHRWTHALHHRRSSLLPHLPLCSAMAGAPLTPNPNSPASKVTGDREEDNEEEKKSLIWMGGELVNLVDCELARPNFVPSAWRLSKIYFFKTKMQRV